MQNVSLTTSITPIYQASLHLLTFWVRLIWTTPHIYSAFGLPGHIDLLLGADIFVSVLRQGQRMGPPGAPVALETEFGWVLSGNTEPIMEAEQVNLYVTTFHSFTSSCDDILKRLWEIEESPSAKPTLTLEERTVVKHFDTHHCRADDGSFVVPLPKRSGCKSL